MYTWLPAGAHLHMFWIVHSTAVQRRVKLSRAVLRSPAKGLGFHLGLWSAGKCRVKLSRVVLRSPAKGLRFNSGLRLLNPKH